MLYEKSDENVLALTAYYKCLKLIKKQKGLSN